MSELTNFDTFNYFFGSLIASCCFILAIPSMSTHPNTLLFCYFFIAVAMAALFLNWYFKSDDSTYRSRMLQFVLPSLLFMVVSLVASFLLVSNNKTKIQKGFVTNYYYKFNMVTIWLILIECYIYYNMYLAISKTDTTNNQPQTNMMSIICFCFLSYFVIWSNSIGLKHYSADG